MTKERNNREMIDNRNVNITNKIQQFSLEKKIAQGGYGSVYSCKINNKNVEFAVKCIDTNITGVPCLMEASIMTTLDHPYINKAIHVYAEPKKMYIIQEIAYSDLKSFCVANRNISKKQYIIWFNMLLQSVNILHKNDIIHGDIKANNVLIYSDNNIRITDFTLSTMNTWERKRSLFTVTHRPYECWNKKSDKKSDIWALGCTFYEILTGHSLFYAQKKESSINAILYWARNGPNKEDICIECETPVSPSKGLTHEPTQDLTTGPTQDLTKGLTQNQIKGSTQNQIKGLTQNQIKGPIQGPIQGPTQGPTQGLKKDLKKGIEPERLLDIEYKKPRMGFNFSENMVLSQLAFSMMHFYPKDRPNASEVLLNPIFKEFKTIIPINTKFKSVKITEYTKKRIIKILSKYNFDQKILEMVYAIYGRLKKLPNNHSDRHKIYGCAWIASKLIKTEPIPINNIDIFDHQIRSIERDICHHLNFRFHDIY